MTTYPIPCTVFPLCKPNANTESLRCDCGSAEKLKSSGRFVRRSTLHHHMSCLKTCKSTSSLRCSRLLPTNILQVYHEVIAGRQGLPRLARCPSYITTFLSSTTPPTYHHPEPQLTLDRYVHTSFSYISRPCTISLHIARHHRARFCPHRYHLLH